MGAAHFSRKRAGSRSSIEMTSENRGPSSGMVCPCAARMHDVGPHPINSRAPDEDSEKPERLPCVQRRPPRLHGPSCATLHRSARRGPSLGKHSPQDQKRHMAWEARKAEHAESPLAYLHRGEALVETRPPGVRAEARVGQRVVARTERAQIVNRRVYFPLEDCVLALLRDSPKRWR